MIWKTRPRSDFGTLKAVVQGSGPAVLLLHGVGLRAEAWGAQIEDLAQDYTVIAPTWQVMVTAPCCPQRLG